jgi:hypothetical protein
MHHGVLARPQSSRASGISRATKSTRADSVSRDTESVRRRTYARSVSRNPTRIDLLELDIDLRITDLWREAADVSDWNLEVVAAFIRAAYGKGYCDALTEESPGALCVDHGYRMPERPAAARLRSVPDSLSGSVTDLDAA